MAAVKNTSKLGAGTGRQKAGLGVHMTPWQAAPTTPIALLVPVLVGGWRLGHPPLSL